MENYGKLIERQEASNSKRNLIKSFLKLLNYVKEVNKTNEARRCREQRKLSRKYESLKKRNMKGEATRQNIQKQRLTVQRIYYRLDCNAALNLRDTERYKIA